MGARIRKILILAVVCVAAGLWCFYPRTFSQTIRIDTEKITKAWVYVDGVTVPEDRQYELTSQDAALAGILERLESVRYTPMVLEDLKTMLRLSDGEHPAEMEAQVTVILQAPGGGTASVRMNGWEGIQLGTLFYQTEDSQAFQQAMLDYLRAADPGYGAPPVPAEYEEGALR